MFLVGLSGGADSVALTHMLSAKMGFSVVACHVNHHLRGEESDRDMAFAEAFCQSLKIPCTVLHAEIGKIAAEKGLSVEEAGREERYRLFAELADRLERECGKKVYIATAHTRSDNLETVLFRLTRGTGLAGLCGIPASRGKIIRPLLSWTREEIEQYCKENGLSFVTDSTNRDVTYSRNRIRHRVVPELKKINPQLEGTFAHTISVLSEENDFIEQEARKEYVTRIGADGLLCQGMEALHPALRKRIWRIFFVEQGISVTKELLTQTERMILQKKGKLTVNADLFLTWDGMLLRTESPEVEEPYFEMPLSLGEYESRSGKKYKIQSLEIPSPQSFHKVYKNLFDIFLDCDKICGSIILRQRKNGDKIKLSHKDCTKTFRKLFQEDHIPAQERGKLFVLADEKGVIALEHFGVDKRVVCDEHTKRCIRITEREVSHHE